MRNYPHLHQNAIKIDSYQVTNVQLKCQLYFFLFVSEMKFSKYFYLWKLCDLMKYKSQLKKHLSS